MIRAFLGPRVQYAGTPASLQASLEKGVVPADLVMRKESRLRPLNSEVASAGGRDLYERGSAALKEELLMQGACWGMLTGAMVAQVLPCAQWAESLGMMAAASVPIVGGFLAGLGIGCWLHRDQKRDARGETTVELNGTKQTVSWQGDPDLRKRSASEVTAVLTALGELGDEIPPGSAFSSKPLNAERMAQLEQQKQNLSDLAGQRRLLADLGQPSKLGIPALQMVDASGAREVFGAGGKLYVVEVQRQDDLPHLLSTTSFSDTRQLVSVDQYSYVERTLDYKLIPVNQADQLSQTKLAGTGLPEGIFGVYAGRTRYSQIVARAVESGKRAFSDDHSETRLQHSERARRVSAVGDLPAGTTRHTLELIDRNSSRALAIAGGLIGAAGAALLGFEPITAGACVATAGYLIGCNS